MQTKVEEQERVTAAKATKPARGKRARGLPSFGTRLRRFIWSWWVWALAAAAAATWKHWTALIVLGIVAFLAFLFAPSDTEPTYGLDHEFAVDSDEFLATMSGAIDTPITSGNRIDVFNA